MNRIIYVCSKPLQLIISLILLEKEENRNKNICIFIIDDFANSIEISNSLNKLFPGISTTWHKNKKNALNIKKISDNDEIYIDSDVGIRNAITLTKLKFIRRNITLHLYEEGIGTYRTNLTSSFFRKLILPSLGIGTIFGQCWATDQIHVFEPIRYLDKTRTLKEVHRIPTDIKFWLEKNLRKISDLFSGNTEINELINDKDGSRIAHLYLSGWTLKKTVIQQIQKQSNSFFKAHPHIKDLSQINNPYKLRIIPNHIPAEIILITMLEQYNKIYVYHEQSSSLHYIKDKKIIECII